jgi:hypothetical protein
MQGATIDYDLHGLAGVRVLDANPRDAAVVDRQLGPIRARLEREPDIVIRFVDRLELGTPLRLLGVGEAGFTDDAFLILRGPHKTRQRVRVPLEDLGRSCEIVCERGLRGVPLLIATLNLTVLAHGVLPLHASAFTYNGLGAVVTGWSKAGKTEALLAFASRGARFVGDEWVYVEKDGATVHGIAEPIRVWDWYLEQLPALRGRLPGRERARLAALRAAARAARGRRGQRLAAALNGQRHVDLPPGRLFAEEPLDMTAPFDRLFFVESWESRETETHEIDAAEVPRRMVFSLLHERAPLLAAYEQFRFAFPERRNAVLEDAPELERALLERATAGKLAHLVRHPYPADLSRLFEVMGPLM